jgi:hypothetical protein
MATKYYADVKRYKTEREGESLATLLNEAEVTRVPDTNIITNTAWYVYYVIDIYASNIQTFSDWQTAFNAGTNKTIDGRGILVSTHSSTNQTNGLEAGLTIGVTVSPGTTDNNVHTGGLIYEDSHYRISFNRTSKTTNGQVVATPKIEAYTKSTLRPNATKISGINWRTTSNVVPSITWTTTHTQPTFPAPAIEIATRDASGVGAKLSSGYEQTVSNYYYDICSTQWWFLIYHLTQSYSVLWSCDKNGNTLTAHPAPKDADLVTKSSKLKFSQAALQQWLRIKSSSTDCNAVDQVTYQNIPTEEPKDVYRYNPPPYDQASRTSFSEKLIYDTTNDYSYRDLYTVTNRLKTVPTFAASERGTIYQDVNGAKTLNRNPDKLKEVISTGSNQWGFRFMYNPTTFSYNTTSNNSIDWTLGSKDPASLLTGNSTVSFELYLNRIPDLSYLRMSYPEVPQKQLYGRDLKPWEIEGILNRGTEYDIEFLYRVLNGDPLKKPLLFDSLYEGATADFGYTTGVPCWLQLNKNLKYFGSVTGFQVNHVMFDLNMVPMLSTVNITFSRYPALWTDSSLPASVVGADSIKQWIANGGKAPGS